MKGLWLLFYFAVAKLYKKMKIHNPGDEIAPETISGFRFPCYILLCPILHLLCNAERTALQQNLLLLQGGLMVCRVHPKEPVAYLLSLDDLYNISIVFHNIDSGFKVSNRDIVAVYFLEQSAACIK